MKQSNQIKKLLQKDFAQIFNDFDLFVNGIPSLAKVMGVENFIKAMKLNHDKYYRRIENTDTWKISELKEAKKIFEEFNFGTSK